MRVLLLANNWGGLQITKFLHGRGEHIIGLVLHGENNRKFAPEIRGVLGLPDDKVWSWPDLGTAEGVEAMRRLEPDLIITAFWAHLLKPDLIEIARQGCINLHPGLLPQNRGPGANVWPILDGSPAGVTVHYIDEGADTGDIITQRHVTVTPFDTGGSLHQKLTRELVDLFQDTWPSIRAGTNPRTPQDEALATRHRYKDMAALDEIDLSREYKARDLLNLLRARTYPPYPSAYFVENGERVHVRVQLLRDDELANDGPPSWA